MLIKPLRVGGFEAVVCEKPEIDNINATKHALHETGIFSALSIPMQLGSIIILLL